MVEFARAMGAGAASHMRIRQMAERLVHTEGGVKHAIPNATIDAQTKLLDSLTPQELKALKNSFFELLQKTGYADATQPRASPEFGAPHPRDVLLNDNGHPEGYFSDQSPDMHAAPERARSAEAKQPSQADDNQRADQQEAQSGRFFTQSPQGTAAATHQHLIKQKQHFLAREFAAATAQASGDRNSLLGPNATFEDVLAHVLMTIAKKEERNVMERIKVLERGAAGIYTEGKSMLANLGGVAGGALGGYVGGQAGALLGQGLGEKLVQTATGSTNPESRQLQFEQIKHMMHRYNEMMSCLSTMLSEMHRSTSQIISHIKS